MSPARARASHGKQQRLSGAAGGATIAAPANEAMAPMSFPACAGH
jgi:hypothetical protein